jgi:thiamine-phosphate pyrophosphorylase
MKAEATALASATSAGVARIRGLYAITPDLANTREMAGQVHAALVGGCRLVQYRNKLADSRLAKEQAIELRALTRQHESQLIINDHVLLALEVDADGVHLGKEDGGARTIHFAKEASSSKTNFLVGVSCYNQPELADLAAAAGADYVAFGSMFVSRTKPAAVHAPHELLATVRRRCRLPIVAIGGISTGNARSIIEAGADAIAVISDLFGSGNMPEITARARLFTSYFHDHV